MFKMQKCTQQELGQEATKSFGVYSELVIMNEMCIGES